RAEPSRLGNRGAAMVVGEDRRRDFFDLAIHDEGLELPGQLAQMDQILEESGQWSPWKQP
ncbi:hypothetical protein MYX65_13215, partial [Acidobacteria bacterium AH-259-L09]|nr:hypothetical protein [Acidobacteria bacterium AH-259-L09]